MTVKRVKAHTMSRIEEIPNLRSFFRQNQYDEEKKIWLVTQLRDVAIKVLEPLKAKIPRVLPDRIREAYQAKGISLEWDLTTTDAYEFCFMVRNAGVSPSQQSAANLLDACTRAREENAVSDRVQQHILDAYAGLAPIGNKRGISLLYREAVAILEREGVDFPAKRVRRALEKDGVIRVESEILHWTDGDGRQKRTPIKQFETNLSRHKARIR